MKTLTSFSKRNLVTFSLVISLFSFLFYAYEDGITGRTLKSSQPGCLCHSETNSPNVNVVIEGPGILKPGETADYAVRISGGPLVRGGTNIAVSSGTLLPGEGLQKIGTELTHVQPKIPQGGEVVFNFTYSAPNNPATVTLYANGNSVNYSGTEFGDSWNFAESRTIVVDNTSDVKDEGMINDFYLSQNYPNPFNPVTKISWYSPTSGWHTLKVFDILGNEVTTLMDEYKSAGNYEIEFSAKSDGISLSSGIYYYQLAIGNFKETKKMILIK